MLEAILAVAVDLEFADCGAAAHTQDHCQHYWYSHPLLSFPSHGSAGGVAGFKDITVGSAVLHEELELIRLKA